MIFVSAECAYLGLYLSKRNIVLCLQDKPDPHMLKLVGDKLKSMTK